ncbi:MAG: peroxiredoxin [Thermoplasmata archaeon]
MPPIRLPSTSGRSLRLDRVPPGFDRLVVYAYPMTGLPGVAPPESWDDIPGARGCTAESCGFRDHAGELAERRATVVGLSTQSTPYQREMASRLGLSFPVLSDSKLRIADALGLPTFTVSLPSEYDGGGLRRLLKRLTLVVRDGAIEKVFYPVFPPEQHADEVLRYLKVTGPRE